MAAAGIYKLDNGNSHLANCFPARSLLQRRYEEGAGHWEVARQAAGKMKAERWLGSKSTRIKWRGPELLCGTSRPPNEKTLTGPFLIKLHHVKSPSQLCSVDISNQNLTSAKEEDFEQFDSVAYVNATENLLTLEAFRKLPALRELDLSLNGLRNLKVNVEDFPHLEILDLSYNNLSPEDIRALGVLPHLKALHLTANGLSSLPLDLAVPDGNSGPRFPALEVLLLDDNHLSHPNVFVSLANLRSLKQLNLDRNGIKEVPYLHHVENSRFSIHLLSAKSGIRKGLRNRESAEIQRKRDVVSGLSEQADCLVVPNSADPDRTEDLATCSPVPSVEGESPVPCALSAISSTSFGQEFALPLMELRYLSLANNEIRHEEDLLAVALFPSLTELTFYGNPFTTSRSGDPPLLTSFLQDKLGIKLVRKKVPKLEKPRIFIPVKANRKVKSPLPKVRKHPPMLEAPLETAFWQWWTRTEPDLDTKVSVDGFEPLPAIHQFPAEKRPSGSPSRFREESESGLPSTASSLSPDDKLGSVPEVPTSLDHLYGLASQVPSMLDQIPSASLPPSRSVSWEPSGLGQAASASAEQDPSRSLTPTQERIRSEIDTSVGTSPTEQELSELVPPPGSSGQEAEPSEHSPPTGPPVAEEVTSQVLQSTSSAAGQPVPPPDPPSEQQVLSEPVPPTGEQDLAESLPPFRSPSVGQNLPGTPPPTEPLGQLKPVDSLSLRGRGQDPSGHVLLGRSAETDLSGLGEPTGPPPEEEDRVQLDSSHVSLPRGQNWSETVSRGPSGIIPPPNSLIFEPELFKEPAPHGLPPQDLLEPTSPARSFSEDLPKPHPLVKTPSATQDPSGRVPPDGSSSQEQVLPDSVPPTGPPARDQDLTGPVLPPDEHIEPEASPPSTELDQVDSLPPVALMSQEPNRSDAELRSQPSSVQQAPPKSVPETGSLSAAPDSADGISGAEPLPEEQVAPELRSQDSLSAGELHLLFEHKSFFTSLSRERVDKRSSTDSRMAEEMESFFMTQVAEALDKEETPHEEASAQPETKPHPVPKRYKGYEELLDGPTDPDFIEPRGILQNVKALEWALRHPLVYRDTRARLDSFQKPYVPMVKKVLRVPVPPIEKTKAQRLEELLEQMREPTNIIELPLVCILRRKKSNWREYREALALLKDFRKQYKATVAAAGEARSVLRKPSRRGRQSQARMLESLTRIKGSGPCVRVPSAPPAKDDQGLGERRPSSSGGRA